MIEPTTIVGGSIILAAAVWFYLGSRRSDQVVHGQINDLIQRVKSEKAKQALREAGKALYESEEA